MNRLLMIPAVGCLFAFAALLAALYGAAGGETNVDSASSVAHLRRLDRGEASDAYADALLSSENAERLLTTLAREYLRPWRQWENSPHRLYSRAAPRPVPTTSSKVELAHGVTTQSDCFLVATITIVTGKSSQPIPCVVNRSTREALVFSEGQWLSADEWLKKAPVP